MMVRRYAFVPALLAILVATLSPVPASDEPYRFWPPAALADIIRNIVLFVPLGWGLALRGLPARRVVLRAQLRATSPVPIILGVGESSLLARPPQWGWTAPLRSLRSLRCAVQPHCKPKNNTGHFYLRQTGDISNGLQHCFCGKGLGWNWVTKLLSRSLR